MFHACRRLEIIMDIWYLFFTTSNISLMSWNHSFRFYSQLVLGLPLPLFPQIYSCNMRCKKWYFSPFNVYPTYCSFLYFILSNTSKSLSIFLKTSTFVILSNQNMLKILRKHHISNPWIFLIYAFFNIQALFHTTM